MLIRSSAFIRIHLFLTLLLGEVELPLSKVLSTDSVLGDVSPDVSTLVFFFLGFFGSVAPSVCVRFAGFVTGRGVPLFLVELFLCLLLYFWKISGRVWWQSS